MEDLCGNERHASTQRLIGAGVLWRITNCLFNCIQEVLDIEKKGNPEEPNDLDKSQNTFESDAPYQKMRGNLKESRKSMPSILASKMFMPVPRCLSA